MLMVLSKLITSVFFSMVSVEVPQSLLSSFSRLKEKEAIPQMQKMEKAWYGWGQSELTRERYWP
jgi:hypothetical protein